MELVTKQAINDRGCIATDTGSCIAIDTGVVLTVIQGVVSPLIHNKNIYNNKIRIFNKISKNPFFLFIIIGLIFYLVPAIHYRGNNDLSPMLRGDVS